MLSQYSTKVKVRMGLGILTLIVASVPVVYPYPLRSIGWILVVAGTALASWGLCCHAREKRFELPAWSRWLLVLPVGAAVYVAVYMFVRSVVWFVYDMVSMRFDLPMGDYPFEVVRLVIINIAGSYCFIVSGARTAPKHRVITAVVLAICPLCVHAYVLPRVFMWFNFGMFADIWTSWVLWVRVPWTSGFVAAIVACVMVRRRECRIRTIQQELSNNSLERTREPNECPV